MRDKEKSKAQLIRELEDMRQEVTELRRLKAQYERAAEELRVSEQRLNSLINAIPDVIYKLDMQGRIEFISDAIKKYGYTPEALIGTPIMDLVHPEDREKAAYGVRERRTGDRKTQSLEVRFLSKDRDDVAFELKTSDEAREPAFLVSAEGIYTSSEPKAPEFAGTQGVARDISERKRMEAALQEAERVRVLIETAGAAAHEISQPLQVIMGLCQILQMDTASDDPRQETIETIYRSGERVSEIVQKMRHIRQYATKQYVGDQDIVDLDAASREEEEDT